MMRANGFTLVELLAAMVAGSLLLLSLGWSVSTLAQRLPIEQDEAHLAQLERFAPIVTGWIEQMQPPDNSGQGFAGQKDKMVATIPAPMAAGHAGPVRLTLAVRGWEDKQALFAKLEVRGTHPLPDRLAGEQLLAGGFKEIMFSYAKAEGTDPRLPKLITIHFTDEEGATRRISAAPRLDSDGRCQFDPISMTCRR